MLKRFLSFLIVICMLSCSMLIQIDASTDPVVRNNLDKVEDTIADIDAHNQVFYLPSNIDPKNVHIETSAKTYSVGGKSSQPMPENGTIDITPGETLDKYGNTCYIVSFDSLGTYTFYSGSAIGAVYVATSGGINPLRSSREYKDKQSKLVITDESGKVIYSDIANETLSEIKGRGNASFSNEKKPFQIKLGKKTDLFGMGKAKTWILLANYNDSSYIRNTLAFRIADALELPYTPKSVFVELYIDNEYQGIYQLSEKTQIGTNRIEITDLEELNEKENEGIDLDSLGVRMTKSNNKFNSNLEWYQYASGMLSPENIKGGYLVELDNLYSYREKCTFGTRNQNTYTVKSPEVSSKEEMEYIADLFSGFEQALYAEDGKDENGKYYTEYCDLESLVKVYIVEEITKNWDAYVGSVFFHVDVDGIIHAGPVWDFDNTWGNIRGRGSFATNLEEPWAFKDQGFGYGATFGGALMQHEDAKELAAELYPVAASFLEDALLPGGYIEILTETISASAAMDMARWPVEQRNYTFIYFNTYSDGTVDSCVGYLTNFINVRTAALYDFFGADKTPHEHVLEKIDFAEPSCEEEGHDEYWKCSICGKLFSDEEGKNKIKEPAVIPPLGHNWGEWEVVEEADYNHEGLERRVCRGDSSHVETRVIPRKERPTTVTESVETTTVETAETQSDTSKTTESTAEKITESGNTTIIIWICVIVGVVAIFVALVVIIVGKRKTIRS